MTSTRPGRRLAVFANDPIWQYVEKGEIKPRYFNPCDLFDEVHLITPTDRDVRPSDVQELVGRANLEIHPLGAPSALGLPNLLRRAGALVRHVDADVIRGHGMLFGGLAAVWAGRAHGIPVVLSLHSNEDTDLRGLVRRGIIAPSPRVLRRLAWLALFERYILSHANEVICRYEAIRTYALRRGTGPTNTRVIYNWIDVDRFCPTPVHSNARLRVIAVGRQAPEKDPTELIRALRHVDVELLLIGRGSLHEELKRRARAEGVADRVTFVPDVKHAEIHRCYQSADVSATCISVAGVSMGTMEGMAAGLPVVCARTPWEERPDVFGDLAMMVEPTAAGFADAFRVLAGDPSLRARLGASARERMQQIRGDVMERAESELYREVIARRRPERRATHLQ
jgi:glycosyltransferase involved in cell wall biosynthesis